MLRRLFLATGLNSKVGGTYQVNKDGSWHIFSSRGFIVVDIDPLQLKVRCANIGTSGVNTVLIRNDLPELEIKIKTKIMYYFHALLINIHRVN